MSAGGCGDPSVVQGTAAELFQLAAMLMGDQGEAVKVVETTLESVDIDPCLDPAEARRLNREGVLAHGLTRLRQIDPASFAEVPKTGAGMGCVEDEDLTAAGVSQAQLTEWLAVQGRHDLREWLCALPGAQRAIFVQRAVLGQSNAAVAGTLEAAGSAWWSPEAVGQVYRMALCSLANSLAHSPGAMAEAHAGAYEVGAAQV